MIATRLNAKLVFFDRSVIKRNWRRINKYPLAEAGLKVRRIARGSIRRGGVTKKGIRKPSRPGRPPKSWPSGKTPPFKMIYSVPDRLGARVTVGMVGFSRTGTAIPGLHERGGRVRRRVFLAGVEERDVKGRFLKRKRVAVTKMVHYPERPFMQPALQKEAPRLPRLWQSSIGE